METKKTGKGREKKKNKTKERLNSARYAREEKGEKLRTYRQLLSNCITNRLQDSISEQRHPRTARMEGLDLSS